MFFAISIFASLIRGACLFIDELEVPLGNLIGGRDHGENERLEHSKVVKRGTERVCLALPFAEVVLDDIANFFINGCDT